MVYTHNGILLNHKGLKKERKLLLATTGMELKGTVLNQINQKEKDKYQLVSFICGVERKKTKGQTKQSN